MITQSLVALMMASLVSGQMPGTVSATPGGGAGSPSATLVVPAGTTVALTLMTPIQSRTTKVGDTVRAVVAFPVTVGAATAIPAGTYVEGMVNAMSTHGPSVKIHFIRMLFANGYSVPLDAMNTQAAVEWPGVPDIGAQRVGNLAWGGGPPVGLTRQEQVNPTNPTLPPLPDEGPSKAAIIGGGIAGAAALVVLSVVATHHRGSANFVMFDNGWQFQMVLATPLTLDAARVQATAAP
jgi:hypothetical protein